MSDYQGKEYERVEYTPYREGWVEKRADTRELLPYKFTGKERDSETGLYYYGARYLNPRTSRWISSDPAMESYLPVTPVSDEARKRNGNLPGMGGVFSPVNLATYHYGGNNPVKYIDPTGLDVGNAQRINAKEGPDVVMIVIRNPASYNPPRDRNNPTNYALDKIILINGTNLQTEVIEKAQTVSNYPTTDSQGNYVGDFSSNTIAAGRFSIVTGKETRVASGPAFEIINAMTISGKAIGPNATNGLDPDRWLNHSNSSPTGIEYSVPYSKGCFIPLNAEDMDREASTLKRWGIPEGSVVNGMIVDSAK